MDMGKSNTLAEIGHVYKEAFRAEFARQERLARCSTSFAEFVKTYFADSPLLQDETPPFHKELISISSDRTHPEWRYTDPATGVTVQREGLIVATRPRQDHAIDAALSAVAHALQARAIHYYRR
jgi:hypothetical protein